MSNKEGKEEAVAKLILNFMSNTQKTAKAKQTKGFLQARKTLLMEYWAKYIAARDESTVECSEEQFSNVETAYCQAVGELIDLIDLATENNHMHTDTIVDRSLTCNNHHPPKLPAIELPKFSGSFLEWLPFKDMFSTCVIKDESLSNVQRLYYLKSCLRGEADILVRNISVTENNFQIAWDTLHQRYDNKRKLIKSYLREIVRLPPMTAESITALRKVLDGTTEAVRALTQLGCPTAEWDHWLVFLITEKLDSIIVKDWEMSLESPNYLPTYDELHKFLENRIQGLEGMESSCKPKSKFATSSSQAIKTHHTHVNRCTLCSGKHALMFCPDFRQLSAAKRIEIVNKDNLCKNCMKSGHRMNACTSKFTCSECGQKHHTMLLESITNRVITHHLHMEQTTLDYQKPEEASAAEEKLPLILLATAQVIIRSATGNCLQVRALLDTGSQATLVSEYAAQQLRLPRRRIAVPVVGVGGTKVGNSTSLVKLCVGSLKDPFFNIECSALVLPRLGSLSQTAPLPQHMFKEITCLDLADPTFHEPGPIDIILGADVYGGLLCSDVQHSIDETLTAQSTRLGWVLSGQLPGLLPQQKTMKSCSFTTSELDELVQNMWRFNEQESVNDKSSMTQDELHCEEFFKNTVRRTESGRFIVKYPFKTSANLSTLSDMKADAANLFFHQMRRLQRDPKLKSLYEGFMKEYEELGHMEAVPEEDQQQNVCYIPHHGVYKESSTTTKLRIVFNASRKGKHGVSLNDCLLVGPKLQADLSAIILRWRNYKVGFMADITKCFRQIRVDKEDADLQRIIWKNTEGDPISFRLLTVTYGLNCAPYLTIKVLQTLANEEEVLFPNAAKVVRESFYMDDCLHGADTVDAALEIQDQLQKLLLRGGFVLRKWASNSLEFLENLNIDVERGEHTRDLSRSDTSALGVYWRCRTDSLGYRVAVTHRSGPITKRQQLSDLATIYDPLGLLAPVVIIGKLISQQLWVLGCGWDDPLPDPHQRNWHQFREEFPLVERIDVPRWVFSSSDVRCSQLHVFADASSTAYAAVAYLRVETSSGEVKVSLLEAKTKVAPLKKTTIPRLELNGVLLAAKVSAKVELALQLNGLKLYCWSDSKTALSWIRSHPGGHKQYVANRIMKVQELTPVTCWRYVPTSSNPADVATRGVYPSQLETLDIWWAGPAWLSRPEEEWPEQHIAQVESVAVQSHMGLSKMKEVREMQLLHKYSSIHTLVAVTAWCQRFFDILSGNNHETTPWVTANERRLALRALIRYVQFSYFANEISCLSRGKPLSPKSKLRKLNPIIDKDGVLRLDGRLKNARIPESERFPIILPKESVLCALLIADAHVVTLHGGTQVMLHFLRRRYWILDARVVIRRFVQKCVKCLRQKSAMPSQLMGSLPMHRCVPSPPFLRCGLDYGGPYNIRMTKGRGVRSHKGYVALFICLSTRAVHLELVSDMTTEAFLAALKRFFATRGYSSDIYSDCAKTFVGANAVLRKELKDLRKQLDSAAHACAQQGVSWHFIPPGSPNFGGIWEAGIKSMKHHLKRTIGDACLTFEEFFTVLKQIEAILNSRPLSAMSDDPTDLVALTPGHFWAGRSLIAVPEPNLLDTSQGRLTRWKQLQQMQQDFWRRWRCEYLHGLQVRYKWQQANRNLQIGDLVLVRDERTPPAQWPLGRVLEVNAGEDGIVRVACIRTRSSTLKRAISKLIVLPIADDDANGGRPQEIHSSQCLDEVGGEC